jgi:SNF2 family DNA or RNA helicase
MLNLVELDLDAEGFTTSRIDGTLSLDRRQQALRDFTENPNCRVLLASINSAGEG